MTGPDDRAPAESIEGIRGRVARAARFAPIGSAIGAVVGAAGTAALLLASGETAAAAALWSVAAAMATGASGAALAHLVGGGVLLKKVDDATGYDLSAERIRRAIAGSPERLSPQETLRARRAAVIAGIVLPAQRTREILLTTGLGVAGIALLVAGLMLGRPGLLVVPVITLLNSLTATSRIWSIARQIRAARVFSVISAKTDAP